LYAETSAVLRWLLGAPRGEEVRAALATADHVFASRLTIVETRRALLRAGAMGEIPEAAAEAASASFGTASAHWTIVEVLPEIAERASQRFPSEPVRSLDALHLATALFLVPAAGALAVLSTDDRVVRNAPLLGLPLALAQPTVAT
jgi:predicted nucleic acid-binding protein